MQAKIIQAIMSQSYWLLLLLLLYNNSLLAQATTNNATNNEQQIRHLVAQQNEGNDVIQSTDDRIFVSGAYPRPIIGKEMSADNAEIANRMKTERQNFHSTYRIEKLEVSQAGDMAYEFGYGDLSWDTPEKKHISFESSYLRVWKKIQGDWKVAAFFARPNEPVKTTAQ